MKSEAKKKRMRYESNPRLTSALAAASTPHRTTITNPAAETQAIATAAALIFTNIAHRKPTIVIDTTIQMAQKKAGNLARQKKSQRQKRERKTVEISM